MADQYHYSDDGFSNWEECARHWKLEAKYAHELLNLALSNNEIMKKEHDRLWELIHKLTDKK